MPIIHSGKIEGETILKWGAGGVDGFSSAYVEFQILVNSVSNKFK